MVITTTTTTSITTATSTSATTTIYTTDKAISTTAATLQSRNLDHQAHHIRPKSKGNQMYTLTDLIINSLVVTRIRRHRSIKY